MTGVTFPGAEPNLTMVAACGWNRGRRADRLFSAPASPDALRRFESNPARGPGLSYTALGVASQTLANGAAQLDTTPSTSTHAGYATAAPVPLDRTNGFALLFTVQLKAENHNSADRAGFSVIAFGEDKRGIELGFWTNRVFAQSDSPLFTHAEDAPINPAAGFADYVLTIGATHYALRVNGTPVLSGPVRDYTAFVGPIDPYETPNFLFFGDDTSSAAASVSLRRIALVTAPRLTASSAQAICWNGVSNQTYTVQVSTNLTEWATAGAVSSTTSQFCFTNPPASPRKFFRVVYP